MNSRSDHNAGASKAKQTTFLGGLWSFRSSDITCGGHLCECCRQDTSVGYNKVSSRQLSWVGVKNHQRCLVCPTQRYFLRHVIRTLAILQQKLEEVKIALTKHNRYSNLAFMCFTRFIWVFIAAVCSIPSTTVEKELASDSSSESHFQKRHHSQIYHKQ